MAEIPYRTALIIGIMLSLFDQITGINIVIYYIQKILLELGYDKEMASQGMVLMGTRPARMAAK